MDDLHRFTVLVLASMRVIQALGDLHHDISGDTIWHRDALTTSPADEPTEIEPVDIFHRKEELVPLLVKGINLDDVGVVQAHRDLGFVDEHREELRAPSKARQDALDHEDLLDPLGPGGLRKEHLGHAPRPDAAEDPISPQVLR